MATYIDKALVISKKKRKEDEKIGTSDSLAFA